MSRIAEYPTVTPELLDGVVRRVLRAGSPHKIVLFGSHARGDARPDSDLDLLIIEGSDLPRYQRSPRYYHALAGLFEAVEIRAENGRTFRIALATPAPLVNPNWPGYPHPGSAKGLIQIADDFDEPLEV